MAADFLNNVGKLKNIHPVCLLCKRSCKREYSFWSFQMPPSGFCDGFVENEELRKKLQCYEDEFWECMKNLGYSHTLDEFVCDLTALFKCGLVQSKKGKERDEKE